MTSIGKKEHGHCTSSAINNLKSISKPSKQKTKALDESIHVHLNSRTSFSPADKDNIIRHLGWILTE